MKLKNRKYKSLRYDAQEIYAIFVERKLVSPTVHKDKKKFDKKRERQRRESGEI